ncbi:YwiC-like family protein [Cellulomonas sp. H30R-01]|uniref:YwiC-like family protein n=1 Tax=Cellulomonas sp. H30R-01 TaxID=2704467 RepID=UPI00138BB2E5|nr:YwiC-like family protein [Cellulomonas sp. H30R-01]QHT56995.1 YwiC-like family protein [Cellulomonas sp. H30R-01]
MPTTAPHRAGTVRRRRGPGWVPQQHGAWAMLVVPLVVGTVLAGPTWRHALLLVAWLVAFLAYNAAGLWLKASRRPRYRPPVGAYGVATAVLGGLLLAVTPSLLWWAPVFGVLLAVSLVCSARRADRSWLNDGVTVVAAMLMTVVAAGLGSPGPLPGAGDPRAWAATGLLAAYFLGTVPYVKSLIRDRGDRTVLAVSVGYHSALVAGALVAAGVAAPRVAGAAVCLLVGLGLLVRAVLVPRRRPWPSAKAIGVGEVVATVVVTAATLAVV